MKFRDATVLDYLLRRQILAHLVSELDTFWVHYGGHMSSIGAGNFAAASP